MRSDPPRATYAARPISRDTMWVPPSARRYDFVRFFLRFRCLVSPLKQRLIARSYSVRPTERTRTAGEGEPTHVLAALWSWHQRTMFRGPRLAAKVSRFSRTWPPDRGSFFSGSMIRQAHLHIPVTATCSLRSIPRIQIPKRAQCCQPIFARCSWRSY